MRQAAWSAARLAGNAALATFCALVAWGHFTATGWDGRWALYPVVVQELLLAVLFLVRRPSRETSSRLLAWVAGTGGLFLPLLLAPVAERGPLGPAGEALQAGGLVIVVGATLGLGRRLGIVPANRGVQTGGLYAWVRHPMYGGYLLAYLGFVLTFPTARNVAVLLLSLPVIQARVTFEEALLGRDPTYVAYRERVPWRVLPGVY